VIVVSPKKSEILCQRRFARDIKPEMGSAGDRHPICQREICPGYITGNGVCRRQTPDMPKEICPKIWIKLATRTTFWYCQVGDLPETG
jgi:hypothetical protein